MTEFFLSSSYKIASRYRLIVVDPAWCDRLKRRAAKASSHSSSIKRRICLIFKGEQRLYAHDDNECALLRRMEYSNSLLLSKILKEGTSTQQKTIALTSLSAMYDLQPCPPQNNVLSVLRSSYLTSDELLSNQFYQTKDFYTFSQLALLSSSTPNQLASMLRSKGAVIHQGKIRLLHPQLLFSAFFLIYTLLAEFKESLTWDFVEEKGTSFYPLIALKTVKAQFGGADTSILNADKCPVGLAGFIFFTNSNVNQQNCNGVTILGLDKEIFATEWNNICKIFSFDDGNGELVDGLHGSVVLSSSNDVVWWIPEDSLPCQINERLSVLFELRPKNWETDALQAYIQPILSGEQSFPQSILRYAREYRLPGKPVSFSKLL